MQSNEVQVNMSCSRIYILLCNEYANKYCSCPSNKQIENQSQALGSLNIRTYLSITEKHHAMPKLNTFDICDIFVLCVGSLLFLTLSLYREIECEPTKKKNNAHVLVFVIGVYFSLHSSLVGISFYQSV